MSKFNIKDENGNWRSLALSEEVEVATTAEIDSIFIDSLAGYTWVGNDTIDVYSIPGGGKYNAPVYRINFKAPYISSSGVAKYFDCFGIYRDGTWLAYAINGGAYTRVYNDAGHGWDDDPPLNTLVITGGTDATNKELIIWLLTNGTLTKTEEV